MAQRGRKAPASSVLLTHADAQTPTHVYRSAALTVFQNLNVTTDDAIQICMQLDR